MSERAAQLADRVEQEVSRMITFVDGLTESQLEAACQDPMGNTVRHVLAHLREGTDQVADWAASVANGTSANDAADHNHDHSHGDHSHGDHSRGDDVPLTIDQLHHLKAVLIGTISGLTDKQLDFVPPPSGALTDGTRSLHGIVAFIVDDVANHLRHLTQAVASPSAHV